MTLTKKVVFFTGTLDAGGLERFVSSVCIEARRRDLFVPMVICLLEKRGVLLKALELAEIRVVQAPSGWQRSLTGMIELGKLVKDLNADIVHSQVNFSIVQQFLICRWVGRARFMVTERNCYPLSGSARIRRVLQFHLLKLFGVHYSANSSKVASHLSRLVHYPASRIPVITNGIDVTVRDTEIRRITRERHHWTDKDFVIGYIARFAPHKGHEFFIRTTEILYRRLGVSVKVCLVGDGPQRMAIEKMVDSMGLTPIVTFTGIIGNIGEYYQAFDSVALLSEFEGMPNVVLEAMAFGLPVVANRVGNAEELLQDGAGVINRSSDANQVANTIMDLIASQETRDRISKRAVGRIREEFSLQHTLTTLCKYYDHVG
jgi:glycosyltransferase involved in cell wall biosynthesis